MNLTDDVNRPGVQPGITGTARTAAEAGAQPAAAADGTGTTSEPAADDNSAEAWKAREAIVHDHADAIHHTLGVNDQVRPPRHPRPKKGSNNKTGRFGKNIGDAAVAAVKTFDGCQEAFTGASERVTRLAANNQRMIGLRITLGTMNKLTAQIKEELAACTEEVVGGTEEVYTITSAALKSPANLPYKAKLERASGDLNAIADGRKATVRTRRAVNKAQKTEVKAVQAEAASSSAEVAKLELENKYLEGVKLRPADLPVPTASGAVKATTGHTGHSGRKTGQ